MTRPTCTIEDCHNTVNARGLCYKHYKRQRRNGDPRRTQASRYMTTEDYLLYRTDREGPGGCWLWTGPLSAAGYGQASRNNTKMLAHRLSYTFFVGSIPDKNDIRHRCDVRSCVNPKHLEPGTRADNNRDTSLRDRHGNAKLTNNDVLDIRWMHGLGASGSSLAKAYEVTPTLISQVVNRKARTNV